MLIYKINVTTMLIVVQSFSYTLIITNFTIRSPTLGFRNLAVSRRFGLVTNLVVVVYFLIRSSLKSDSSFGF